MIIRPEAFGLLLLLLRNENVKRKTKKKLFMQEFYYACTKLVHVMKVLVVSRYHMCMYID